MQIAAILIEDFNGDHNFDVDKVAFGYVAPNERLYVRASVLRNCQTGDQDQALVAMTAFESLAVMYDNYRGLIAAGHSAPKAIRMSILRSRWIKMGCLLQNLVDRKTPVNEVVVVNDNEEVPFLIDANTPRLDATGKLMNRQGLNDGGFLNELNNTPVDRWVTLASLIWATSAHVFRVRGHHYKDEYQGLYERTWRGTTAELPDSVCNWKELGRTAIHPFGVRALERSAAYFASQGKLPENLLLRRNAVPAGSALIGTTYAAMKMFESTPFWNGFYSAYKDSIDALIVDYHALLALGISAHQYAGLYGRNRSIIDPINAAVLAPVLVGFIDATPARTAIREQRTMNKHASANPLMTEIMRDWITAAVARVAKETDLSIALTGKSSDESKKRVK